MDIEVITIELEYFEDIKNDFIDTYKNHIESDGLNPCVHWFIHENDLYMTSEYPVECACHYLAIGAYLLSERTINKLDVCIVDKIKQSYADIKSGKYDCYFTKEDKKYINEDLFLIETIGFLK